MNTWPHPCLPSVFDGLSGTPIVWSVAGTDSGGGAGLAADIRAAAAFGLHLCPVVAAVTAQNSLGVHSVYPLPASQLQAQLDALAVDMRPRVIKCGLLASVAAVAALARCVDRLRSAGPVALVVDPVLGATAGGAAFADDALITAYREWLLPRATLITPNRREAQRLSGSDSEAAPQLAQALRAAGAQSVCITGGDDGGDDTDPALLARDWLDAEPSGFNVSGWLALPRLPASHHHGSGCTFATAAAAALALGYPLPDAVVLAKMLTWAAVRDGQAAGAGAGPVRAGPGFITDPSCMPVMGFADEQRLDAATLARWAAALTPRPAQRQELGLYAITDQAGQVAGLVRLGLPQIQLRIKTLTADTPAAIAAALAAVAGSTCQLWINDHWQLALAAGADALHLGQEDWAALSAAQRAHIVSRVKKLGISSHSLWELARARGLGASTIACGPVCATTTKDMAWLPQGMQNLHWWARMAGRPVVAIGGLLAPAQMHDCAAAGAAAACLVRAAEQVLGGQLDLQDFERAWQQGRARQGLRTYPQIAGVGWRAL